MKLSDLTPLPDNPRKIEDAAIEKLKNSIKQDGKFMIARPMIIDPDGVILGGNQRHRACVEIGMDDIPDEWVKRVDWTEEEARRFVVVDNAPKGMSGKFDIDLLLGTYEINELVDMGFDADDLLPKGGKVDDDSLPEPLGVVVSVLGDVWLCGSHRVMCGSSTDADNVATLLNGEEPGIMVTDPPYGVNYDASWRSRVDSIGSGYAEKKVINDSIADWQEAYSLFPGAVGYIWHGGLQSDLVVNGLKACDFEIRTQIIWAKSSIVPGRGHYHWQHEPCWYVVKKGKSAKWKGGRKKTTLMKNIQDVKREDEILFVRHDDPTGDVYVVSGDESTIWEIPKPQKSETGHSTQKPVECMLRPIRNHGFDSVYDPFLGSGTTLIASEKASRVLYGMELNPAYVDICLERWQNYTGLEATLEKTGQTFSEIKHGRT